MTAYEWGLVIFLIVALGLPVVYRDCYEPNILNKDSEYFNVRKLERRMLTFKRYLFLYGVLFLMAVNYDNAYFFLRKHD